MSNNYKRLVLRDKTLSKFKQCEKLYKKVHNIDDEIKINQDDMLNVIFDNFLK